MKKTRILFVCMGNICRSPTAEGVMRRYISDAGLHGQVSVDSAGTHAYHEGEAPDPRAQAAALRRGYDLSQLRARRVTAADFEQADLVLAMDYNNLEALNSICAEEHRSKVRLLMTFAPRRVAAVVHDPYLRGAKDFDRVLDCIEDACGGLVEAVIHSAARGA